MKQLLLFFFVSILLVTAGCQKDPQNNFGAGATPGESSDGRLLSRIVFQYSASDSSYTDLLYDSKGRWAGIKTNDQHPMLNDYVLAKLYRSPAGIGTRYITMKDATPGADSAVYRLQYSITDRQYTAKIQVDAASGAVMDSTEYVYKDGRIIAAHLYMRPEPVAPYSEQARAEFTYNSTGNLTGLRSFVAKRLPDSGFGLVSETGFVYDDKVNPLSLGMEAIVLDQIFFVSGNNLIHIVIKNTTTLAAQDEVLDFVYQYHPSNKPHSAQ